MDTSQVASLPRLARRVRSSGADQPTLADGVTRTLRWLRRVLRRALARRHAQWRARRIRDELAGLDGRTLHDLGLERSELESIAAEMTGQAARTRIRVRSSL